MSPARRAAQERGQAVLALARASARPYAQAILAVAERASVPIGAIPLLAELRHRLDEQRPVFDVLDELAAVAGPLMDAATPTPTGTTP